MQNKEKCDKFILFKDGLNTIKINQQSSNQQYECEICDNDSLSPVQLTFHCIVAHHLYPCIECLKLFGNENQLREHKQRFCHGRNRTCPECSIVLSDETMIFEHMIQNHSKQKCKLCTAIIPNELLSQHHRHAHRATKMMLTIEPTIYSIDDDSLFTCNLCKKNLKLEKFISHYIFFHKCSIGSLVQAIFDSCGKAVVPLELLKSLNDDCEGATCSDCRAKFTFSIPKIFHKVYCLGLKYCVTCNSCFDEQKHPHKHSDEDQISDIDYRINSKSIDKLLNYPFNCHLCGIDFKSIENNLEPLIEHFRSAHDVNDKVILGLIKKIEPTWKHGLKYEKPESIYSKIRSNEDTKYEQKKIISFDTKMVKYLYSSDSDYDSPDDTDEWSVRSTEQRRCHFCRFSSKSKYVFSQHLHEKHGFLLKMPKFDCGPCKKTFTIRQNLQKHIKTVHHKQKSIEEKRYKCSFCSYASNCKQRTRNHIRDHVESSYHPCTDRAVGFNCKYCHFVFWTREKLSEHVLSRHSENVSESYLLCNICVATFTNLATFRQHAAFRHFDERQPSNGVFQCSICRLAYPSIEAMRCHMSEAHPTLKAIYCNAENCMQIIDDHQQLETHWSNKHIKTSFQCTKCLKLFEKQEFVLKHWHRIHSNAKKKI